MFKKVIFLSFLVLASGMLSAMDRKAVDELIVKMEKAVDPKGISKKIKSQVTKANISVPAQQIKMNMIMMDKFPDKSKEISSIPGVMESVRVYNGKQGWEYSKSTGLRAITGKELLSLKFNILIKNPAIKLREAFSEITVADKLEKVGEFECYKMTCKPKKGFDLKPMFLYVDNKKFLTRKLIMTAETQMGPIEAVSIMRKFKEIDGLMLPTEIELIQMGMKMNFTIVEIKNNVDIPDSEFDKPKEDE